MDGLQPNEPLFLNYGLYNLGFLGLNPHHSDSLRLLDWWGKRTFEIGYNDVCNGLFVDQLWMNFAPIFFNDVKILYDKGCNMGPWNLHERKIKKITNNAVVLENDDLLIFYHFSSYKFTTPEFIAKFYTRYSFDTEPNLKILYSQYHSDLLRLGIEKYFSVPYVYGKRNEVVVPSKLSYSQRLKNKIKTLFT